MTGRPKAQIQAGLVSIGANTDTLQLCEPSLDATVSTSREFPDPLADWEELEPGLQERRNSAQARE